MRRGTSARSECAGRRAARRPPHPRSAMQRFGMDLLTDSGRRPSRRRSCPTTASGSCRGTRCPARRSTFRVRTRSARTAAARACGTGSSPALSAAAASVGAFTPHIRSVTVANKPRADSAGLRGPVQRATSGVAVQRRVEQPRLPDRGVVRTPHTVVARGCELDGLLPAVQGPDPGWGAGSTLGESVDRLVLGQRTAADDGGHGWTVAAAAVVAVAAAAGAGRQAAEAEGRLTRGRGRPCRVPPPPT